MTQLFKPGDKVRYIPFPNCKAEDHENGIVFSVDGDRVFVVYNCNGQWNKYKDYPAVQTPTYSLKHGWK